MNYFRADLPDVFATIEALFCSVCAPDCLIRYVAIALSNRYSTNRTGWAHLQLFPKQGCCCCKIEWNCSVMLWSAKCLLAEWNPLVIGMDQPAYDDDVSFYNSTASTWTLATPRTTSEYLSEANRCSHPLKWLPELSYTVHTYGTLLFDIANTLLVPIGCFYTQFCSNFLSQLGENQ